MPITVDPLAPAARDAAERLAYSVPEGARIIGIGRSKLYELIHAGEIPVRKLGSRTLVLREDLERYIASLPLVEPAA